MTQCNKQVFCFFSFDPGKLAKSNQIRATIETKISDCRPPIAKTVLYCCADLI